MANKKRALGLDEPLKHGAHKKPVTRRDFLAQGFVTGGATLAGASVFSLFANPRQAYAALSTELNNLKPGCGIAVQGAGKIPFICFDLAGGANTIGSNVLAGGPGGQDDLLTTAGYNKMGLPGDQIPGLTETTPTATSNGDFTDTSLGLAFHSDSAFLRGILEKTSAATRANIHGAVIPARSDNDTGNNPHNPMYGIFRSGADGELLSLIGSRSSDSGGNSMAPAHLIDPGARPTKVDRPSDVTGLVDTGKLVGLLSQADAVQVMESIYRISDQKMTQGLVNSGDPITNQDIESLVQCGYLKAADLTDRYGDPSTLNPELDTDIVGAGGIFSTAEFNSEGEFRKTASVMKMVVNGFAGAGTVTMGGFDYHTGERGTGELRDLRAGRCMGACLEYAARLGVPLFLYVFSDGSVASNGRIDESMNGRGKGEWTGDNSSTAASFFLVYNPIGRPEPVRTVNFGGPQIGYFRPDGSVETSSSPAANNVNLLVNTVILNYMALHGAQGDFANTFSGHGLGNSTALDNLTAFQPIVNGIIS